MSWYTFWTNPEQSKPVWAEVPPYVYGTPRYPSASLAIWSPTWFVDVAVAVAPDVDGAAWPKLCDAAVATGDDVCVVGLISVCS